MTYKFKKIGLIGRSNTPEIAKTLKAVCDFFELNEVDALIDEETFKLIEKPKFPVVTRDEIGEQCDLAVVVGGDGSILHAARALSDYDISVIGIHRGRLGFLTDIAPDNINYELHSVLKGNYVKHELLILHTDIIHKNKVKKTLKSVNELVLNSGSITRMIEFEVYINNKFVFQQRSDGIIIATPTGSTAYSLSGGGPILTPNVNALIMLPMFPHNLTSRPIVIPDNSRLKLVPVQNSKVHPGISCDGQEVEIIDKDDVIEVYKSDKVLHLLHPSDYNYYETLRTKLHWGTKPV